MEYKFDIFALINIIGVIQGLFLGLIFFNKREDKSLLFLSYFIIASSILSLDSFLGYTNYMFNVIYLNDFSEPLNFCTAPLLYFYCKHVFKKEDVKYKLYHFIPAVLYFIAAIPYTFGENANKYNSYIEAYHPNLNVINSNGYWEVLRIREFHNEFAIFSQLVYFILIFSIVFNLKQFNWKKYKFVSVILGFSIISIFTHLVLRLVLNSDLGDHYLTTFSALKFYIISFLFIQESYLLKPDNEKYKNSGMDSQYKKRIVDQIQLELNEGYHLKNDASLSDFAKHLKISNNQLSQVINEQFQKSYSDLISFYRIEEAKKRMIENPNFSLESIALDIGFNSKSTFYAAFKKHVGITPSRFRNK
jgi:AraC-like DNA-binding protein